MGKEEIELIVDDFIERFFNKLDRNFRDDYKSRYKGIDSPLKELYNWYTDDYTYINIFRAEKQVEDYSNEFEVVDLADIIKAIRNALCNNSGYDIFTSYSERLHIALFKYKAKRLSILSTRRNYVELHFKLGCFNWMDVDDRYFSADSYIEVPLRYLFNKEVLKNLILKDLTSRMSISCDDYVVENMFDIDTIDYYGISQFNVATYEVDKPNFNEAVNSVGECNLKPIVSYKTDLELISYVSEDAEYINLPVIINNTLVLDCIRIYYILMVNNFDYTASEFMGYFDKDCKYDLSGIVNHLNSFKYYERKSFQETYNNEQYGIGMLHSYTKTGLLVYLNKLVKYEYLGQESVKIFSSFIDNEMRGLLL